MTLRPVVFILVVCAIVIGLLGGCSRPLCAVRQNLHMVGAPPPAGADVVLQVAKEKAPCTPKKLFGDLAFPAGTVEWRTAPWMLDGVLVAGDSDSWSCNLDVRVLTYPKATDTALAHEVAHWYWHWCYGRDGEVFLSNGNKVPDADLVRWFTDVNTEAARRMTLP